MILSGHIISSDHQQIAYDLYQNNHEKVIVIAHGFFNSKEAVLLKQLAHSLNDQYDIILFDFRGHGKSQGLFYWTSKEYLDLLGILGLAKQKYRKIGLIGLSLGAATSLITATKTTSIDSIISISAPANFSKIEYHFWNFNIKNDLIFNIFGQGKIGKGVRPGPFWHKKEKPGEIVGKIQTPIFFIHGDADWVISDGHSKELYNNTTSLKRIRIIESGPHADYLFLEHQAEMLHLIREWFQETLRL